MYLNGLILWGYINNFIKLNYHVHNVFNIYTCVCVKYPMFLHI